MGAILTLTNDEVKALKHEIYGEVRSWEGIPHVERLHNLLKGIIDKSALTV